MIKIAIIEDEQIHTDLLADYLRKWGTERLRSFMRESWYSLEATKSLF